MLRLRSLLPALFLTAVGLDAHADALRDIRDIRSGSTPIRHELLGYTDRHEFVFRSLICGNDEMATCRAEITTVHPNADPVTEVLLDINGVDCSAEDAKCAALPDKVVEDFIAAEARVLGELPALQGAPEVAEPTSALEALVTGPVTVAVRTRRTVEYGIEGVRTDLVARAGNGAVVDLATISSFDDRVEYARLEAAYRSADGKHVAFVVAYGPGSPCFGPFDSLVFAVVDTTKARARLANASGLLAKREGDAALARAAFVQASELAPGYPSGWYNRAALSARFGNTHDALESLRRAVKLNKKLATRACGDADFGSITVPATRQHLLHCASAPKGTNR